MSDKVLMALEAKFGPVWIDADGNYWPVVKMTNSRLSGLVAWANKVIKQYEDYLQRVAVAYDASYDDRDWYPGAEWIFDGEPDPSGRYQRCLELIKWREIFSKEQEGRLSNENRTGVFA